MSKELQITTSSLTAKNKAFLAGLLKGKTVEQSYIDAGYKGDSTAAYTLKHRLKDDLSLLINAKSSLDDTLLELDHLDEKELTQTFVTMNQKLRIIALKIQALKAKHQMQESSAPKTFTAFVINRSADKASVQINKTDVVDVPATEVEQA
jgi:hypothetical protein